MSDVPKKRNFKRWLKRVGVIGLVFFTLKGLVWLGIFFFAFKSCD